MRKVLKDISAVLICLAAVLAVSSCGDGLIPRHKFASLLAGMYIEDGYLESRPDLRAQTDTLDVYAPIIEAQGYTVDQYRKTLDYYVEDLKEWNDLFKEVNAILGARQADAGRRMAIELAGKGYLSDINSKSVWIAQTLSGGSIFDSLFMRKFIDTTYGFPLMKPLEPDLKDRFGAPSKMNSKDTAKNEKDTLEIPRYLRREADK